MKLLSLPAKLTKLTFVVAGLVLLFGVFSYGAVRQEQYAHTQASKLAQAQAAAKAAQAKETADWKQLEATVTATQSKLDGACTDFRNVAAKYKLVKLSSFCQ